MFNTVILLVLALRFCDFSNDHLGLQILLLHECYKCQSID